jgi:hypothetical protein
MPTSPNDLDDGLSAEAVMAVCAGPHQQPFTREQSAAAWKVQRFSRSWMRLNARQYSDKAECFAACKAAVEQHFGGEQGGMLAPLNAPAPQEVADGAYGFGIIISTILAWVIWKICDAIWERWHKQ